MDVEARKVLDIRDKELLYLIITHNGKKVAINVGEKTYNSVIDLTVVQTELPLTGTPLANASNTPADGKTFTSKP